MDIDTIRALIRYSDWANSRVMEHAAPLTDAQLDQAFDMGRGSLRATLVHIFAGEAVWLERWQGRADTPWPDERERIAVADIATRHQEMIKSRESFLDEVTRDALGALVIYRDSKGARFTARLEEMIMQACLHSTHHRVQAANMLRRVGAGAFDLDYMIWVRKPVGT